MARRHRRKSHEGYGQNAFDQHFSPIHGDLPGALRQRSRSDTRRRGTTRTAECIEKRSA
jgi:hypothetical protein